MADLLARIVARKRVEIADRLSGRRIDAPPSSRSLRAALSRPGARFIMEIKRRSPSGHRSSLTPEQAATAYAPVTDAISVLTDGPGFGGSLDDLRMVRQRFGGPILAKDFIVDPAQVAEARTAGADAVLVMMSVLDQTGAEAVLAEARRLNMDAIVEVHDETELSRALALGASIVGINNRDLKTMTVDLAVTERLAPLIPEGVLVVAESGIRSHADVLRLSRHVDAFLVGSALMAADNITEAARALVHGRVKLCGLTRIDDIALAANAGATHAGFVMVPDTPRAINEQQAAQLVSAAKAQGLKAVGVFRDSAPAIVAETANSLQLDAIQLHGNEDQAALIDLRSRLPGSTEIWALCGVGERAAPPRQGSDRSLFDTNRNGSSGGTGIAFDWDLIKGRADLPNAFVAGGVGPANARSAASLGAYGIDVGSSVEAAPGIKDAAQIEALFAALRPASRSGK